MVVVRLAKSGAKKNPYYFITVADSRKPRDGGYIERLGFFNPSAKGSEERLRFNLERFDHWVTQGAQASDKVSELVKDARLSPEDLQVKLDAKQAKRTQKKEVLAAQKVAELAAQAEADAKEEAEAAPEAEVAEEAAPEAEAAPAEEEAAPEAEVAEEAAPAEEEAAPEAEVAEEAAPAEEAAAPEAEVAEEAAPAEEEAAPEAEEKQLRQKKKQLLKQK
ncbi:30S ribosomal protein S16 [Gammaproteobacteria bacterium]|nr:30S ribosomal protein S16 [Gammaproteobacteria bacterium]